MKTRNLLSLASCNCNSCPRATPVHERSGPASRGSRATSLGRCAQVRSNKSCAGPEPWAHERDMAPRFGTYLAPTAPSPHDAESKNRARLTVRYRLMQSPADELIVLAQQL
jgi:hypothetical protein